MPKLNKPRGFEVSKETDTITILGKDYEIANLRKGGLTMQSVVLIAVDDKWHEIDVTAQSDSSNLQNFINFVGNHNLTLLDFGIREEKPIVDYSLKHEDYMQLESEFPGYDYYKIAKLDKYEIESGAKSGMYSMRQILKMLVRDSLTVDGYIKRTDEAKNKIINSKPENKMEAADLKARSFDRANQLLELGMVFQNQTPENPKGEAIGHGFTVGPKSIEEDSDEDWNALIIRIMAATGENPVAEVIAEIIAEPEAVAESTEEKVKAAVATLDQPEAPAAETPAKKPISLDIIAALPAERIVELKDLKKNQEAIVAANPIIIITDKATRDAAAKSVQTLLKASTAIDGKTGILANFVTKTNAFIKMGKDYLTPLAKITRDQHDKQKKILEAWDNAALLKKQAEDKAKLLKIQERTNRLFAVPFIFNGEMYSIGTHYVMPSDIEKWTDEEFNSAITKGEGLIAAQQTADEAKNNAIRSAAEQLRPFNAEAADKILIDAGLMVAPVAVVPSKNYVSEAANSKATTEANTFTASPAQAFEAPESKTTAAASTPAAAKPAETKPEAPVTGRFVPSTEYVLPDPTNKVLNTFDVQHFGLIQAEPISPAFIKCRAYFVEGNRQVALEIKSILDGENVVNGLKKSERIAALVDVVIASV